MLEGTMEYRGYRIYFDPPPIPIRTCDWQYVHNEYDGPEDRRCGSARTEFDCMLEIDEIEDDI
jgi:hypothetical protein